MRLERPSRKGKSESRRPAFGHVVSLIAFVLDLRSGRVYIAAGESDGRRNGMPQSAEVKHDSAAIISGVRSIRHANCIS